MMKSNLLIIGAGGHGKVAADIALKMNEWQSVSFLDDNESLQSSLGLAVIGKTADAQRYIDEYDIFIGIGDNIIRQHIQEDLESKGASIPILIHPDSVIGKQVMIQSGTVTMAGSVINSSTEIGKGAIINTGSTVGHDCSVKDYVHVSSGVHIAGTVTIKERNWLGIGSIVSNNIHICQDCIIGAGAVIIDNIGETGTYVGVPARRV